MNRFKKIITLSVLALMSAGVASAQFYLGPRAGLNMSNMASNEAGVENMSIMGFHGGLTAKYQFMKKLSVQMDAIASTMGNRQKMVITADGISTTTETTINSFYAQVPVYINWEKPIMPDNLVPYRVKKSMMSFHGYLGGFFGYGLAASSGTKTTTVTEQPDGSTTTDVTPAVSGTLLAGTYNAIDFGALAGLGFSFRLDEEDMKRFAVDFRYLLGFSDFDNQSAPIVKTNNAVQVSLVFTKKLTKRRYTNRHQY